MIAILPAARQGAIFESTSLKTAHVAYNTSRVYSISHVAPAFSAAPPELPRLFSIAFLERDLDGDWGRESLQRDVDGQRGRKPRCQLRHMDCFG